MWTGFLGPGAHRTAGRQRETPGKPLGSQHQFYNLKSGVRKMACDRAHMEGFYWGKGNGKRGEGREKTGLCGQEQQKRRERLRKRAR